MIYALCHEKQEQFRPVYLFWAGDIINSLLVLVPGAAIGSSSHELTFSTLLNIPYIAIPVWFAVKTLRSPRARDHLVAPRAIHAFFDVAFVVFLSAFVVISVLRFAVAANSNWEHAVYWQSQFEPLLTDPTGFFRVQSFIYFYYLAPAAIVFIYALFVGGSHACIRDVVYLFAGACAQSQFAALRCAAHPGTLEAHRADTKVV